MIRFWLRHVWYAFDCFINALTGGYAGETVSARLWRNRGRTGWDAARRVVDRLFAWDADPGLTHCETAWVAMQQKRFCPKD